MDEEKRYDLEEFIAELEKYRGRHTELVSVYVPAGYSLINIANQLEQEKSTAKNIKSKTTQKNVMDALERLTRHLKLIKKNPENGLALFAGNVAESEGQTDIKVWSIEPPMSLSVRLYRCDQTFVLDPLKEMLEVTEVYGLVVIDRNEATLGLLEGKRIIVLQHMTSGVPGKTEKGGQCLSPDTLIMKEDGELIEIENSHNPSIIVSENFNTEKSEATPLITKWENEKKLFKITTKYPKIEIKASQDHLFFVRTEKGIEEKPLSGIKEGDYLIMPEKINLNLSYQNIEFSPQIESTKNLNVAKIPDYLNEDLAKIFGYYLGDGNYEHNRLTFSEQRKEVAEYYKKLIEKVFGVEVKYRFRENKNYHQLRIHSIIVSQLFKQIFKENNKTLREKIPQIILKSPDKVLANFISGFFDAEGYISSNRIGLGINNEYILRQLQFCLLRFGIVSSIWHYDNRRNPYSNNYRHTLSIDDFMSLRRFSKLIGFSSIEKQSKLINITKKRSNRSMIRQLIVNGKDVARILRNSGLNTSQFFSPSFFVNKRQMNKEIFKEKILNKIKNDELRKRLSLFYNSNLIAIKIFKIEEMEESKTIDIETKNHNFVANGILVHNSAARYARIRDGMAKEFYRRVTDAMRKTFFDMKKLKSIILGGPGPTKEDFLKEGQLVTALREKIIAIKDIGYADPHGLDLLVETSKDVLAEQEITREKKILEDFFNKLGKEREKAAYGFEEVNRALDVGAVDLLILDKKIDRKKLKELEERAKNISSKIEIVSEETEEGQQFRSLGGVGAILRFQI